MTTWYFAYGSNMNPRRMLARGLAFEEATSGHLYDYALRFNKRAAGKQGVAYANIAYQRGARLEGVLYRLEGCEQISVMDGFEGCPIRYSRDVMPVFSPAYQQPIAAWVYVANPAFIDQALLPERRYLDHLCAGARWHSEEYRLFLYQQATVDTCDSGHHDHLAAHNLRYND